MNAQADEVQQRLNFIDRTICHAAQACSADNSVPKELKDYVRQLGLRSHQAKLALHSDDVSTIRQSVEELARLSARAQNVIRPKDGVNYDVKSAVILAHIEVTALCHQLE